MNHHLSEHLDDKIVPSSLPRSLSDPQLQQHHSEMELIFVTLPITAFVYSSLQKMHHPFYFHQLQLLSYYVFFYAQRLLYKHHKSPLSLLVCNQQKTAEILQYSQQNLHFQQNLHSQQNLLSQQNLHAQQSQ